MSAISSQTTNLTIVYSTFYTVADQRKKQSSGEYTGDRWITAQRASNADFCPLDDIIMHVYLIMVQLVYTCIPSSGRDYSAFIIPFVRPSWYW